MPTPGTTTLFFVAVHGFIQCGPKYLIVRRCSGASYGASQWDLPGGMVESGETIEEALIREISEETGLAVEVVTLMRAYTNRDSLPDRQHIEITYHCTYLSGEVQLAPSEHDSFKWLTIEELQNLGLTARGFLVDLLSSSEMRKVSEVAEMP